MTEPDYVEGRNNARYKRDEILVATPHRERVEEVLRQAGATLGESESSEELGLALLQVQNVKTAAAWLENGAGPEYSKNAPQSTGVHDLDPLLAALRAHFKARHGGWSPTIGKNRFLGPVFGGDGAVHHSGGGEPSKVAATDQLPARKAGAGAGVVVGVLDTYIAPHPWLEGGWVADPEQQLPRQPVYAPADGHATFVTGLILAQAPSATVRVRQVLGTGGRGAYAWNVAKEIVTLGRSGIDILNLSLLCQTEDGGEPLVLRTAVNKVPPGVVVVAAAGNHGAENPGQAVDGQGATTNGPVYPAALPEVVAVGASTQTGTVASFTPRDAEWIDLIALGEGVVSTYLDALVELDHRPVRFNGWARWSGSSFSAAGVSGAIAARINKGVTAPEALRTVSGAARKIQAVSGTSWTPRIVSLNGEYANYDSTSTV